MNTIPQQANEFVEQLRAENPDPVDLARVITTTARNLHPAPLPSALAALRRWALREALAVNGWSHSRLGQEIGIDQSRVTRLINTPESHEVRNRHRLAIVRLDGGRQIVTKVVTA